MNWNKENSRVWVNQQVNGERERERERDWFSMRVECVEVEEAIQKDLVDTKCSTCKQSGFELSCPIGEAIHDLVFSCP